jgi:zinc transporter, ZIP family
MLPTRATDVFLYATLTAIATGLGAVPFLFVKSIGRRWLGVANAMAAGFMTAASIGLLIEGTQYGMARTLLGIVLGVALIALMRRVVSDHEVHWGELDQRDSLKILSILGIMTIHSFTEGVGVGVAFGGGEKLGYYITAAIAIHNIPEGLAISLVMVPRGTSALKAGWWSIFSSLPQPLMAVPAFLLVELFRPTLPVGLGFAAGAMFWMVAVELVPEALEETPRATVAATLTGSALVMGLIQWLL